MAPSAVAPTLKVDLVDESSGVVEKSRSSPTLKTEIAQNWAFNGAYSCPTGSENVPFPKQAQLSEIARSVLLNKGDPAAMATTISLPTTPTAPRADLSNITNRDFALQPSSDRLAPPTATISARTTSMSTALNNGVTNGTSTSSNSAPSTAPASPRL